MSLKATNDFGLAFLNHKFLRILIVFTVKLTVLVPQLGG